MGIQLLSDDNIFFNLNDFAVTALFNPGTPQQLAVSVILQADGAEYDATGGMFYMNEASPYILVSSRNALPVIGNPINPVYLQINGILYVADGTTDDLNGMVKITIKQTQV